MNDQPNDLWEDMATLNSLYEELCWDAMDILEFSPDYKNNCIVIRNKTCLLYTSPSPRDYAASRMPSSA